MYAEFLINISISFLPATLHRFLIRYLNVFILVMSGKTKQATVNLVFYIGKITAVDDTFVFYYVFKW